MAKGKLKSIDILAKELKDKFNGLQQNSNLKICVAVCEDTKEKNCSMSLANICKNEILKNGVDAEILSIPSINERFRVFSNDNFVLNAYKKQIANFLELTLAEKTFDGVVFIPSGFYSTMGCLISSIRLNLPTIVLPQGLSQKHNGKNLQDVLSCPAYISQNKMSVFDMQETEKAFCEFAGSGCTFSSENLFNIILEIMDLVVKNSSTTFAQSFEHEQNAILTAKTIVELTKNRLPLKKLINKKSLQNALMLNFCLGGSLLVVDSLIELAQEAEIELDFSKVLGQSKNIPVLFDTTSNLQNFVLSGGTWALIKAMIENKFIDGNYKTTRETTLLEETKGLKTEEFRPIKKESLISLRGNIAEKNSFARTICLNSDLQKVEGVALVFDNDQEAYNAILGKAFEKNSIIFIKNCGKKTDTGVMVISQTALAMRAMGLENILITDGYVCDDIAINCISCVTPDSLAGNFGFVKDGDEIEIDFVKGKLNAEVGNKEFALRQKKHIREHRLLPKYLQKA